MELLSSNQRRKKQLNIKKIKGANIMDLARKRSETRKEYRSKLFFMMMPNRYARCNISVKYGLSKKFYLVHLLISMTRTYNDRSMIIPNHIIKFYRYTSPTSKTKCFAEIKEVLEYMIKEDMIELLYTDLSKVNYDNGIYMHINRYKFYCEEDSDDNIKGVTKITLSELKNMATADYSDKVLEFGKEYINRENLLMFYLYVKSYIFERSDDLDFSEYHNYPEAFFCSLERMASELNMSQKTIERYLKFLTSPDITTDINEPLLVKKTLKSVTLDDGYKIKLPNIYAMNMPGYEDELKWATDIVFQKLENKKYEIKKKHENESKELEKKRRRKIEREKIKERQQYYEEGKDISLDSDTQGGWDTIDHKPTEPKIERGHMFDDNDFKYYQAFQNEYNEKQEKERQNIISRNSHQ